MGEELSLPPALQATWGGRSSHRPPHLECHLQEQWARTRVPSILGLVAPVPQSYTRLCQNPGAPLLAPQCLQPSHAHPTSEWKCLLWKCRKLSSAGGGFGRVFGYESAQGPGGPLVKVAHGHSSDPGGPTDWKGPILDIYPWQDA